MWSTQRSGDSVLEAILGFFLVALKNDIRTSKGKIMISLRYPSTQEEKGVSLHGEEDFAKD